MAAVPSLNFSTLLKRYRLAAGLTQEELAAQSGLSPRGISDLERGERRAPRTETVQLIAEALHLSAPERAHLEAAARGRAATAGPATTSSLLPASRLPPAAPLVGRAEELARLDQVLTDGPPVLLLAGEPGIGKSRLLQAGIERAEALGWRVLAGGCHRRSGQDSYAPLVGALADALRFQTPAQQRLHLEGCAWLVRLLPELVESQVLAPPTWSLPPEQERRLMFAAVARYLANIAGPAGTLLVLDDLHWAGPDALDLLMSLVRAPAERPLRLLGAYRDTDIGKEDPLAHFAADLTREGRANRALLAPLQEREASALLAELLPETADGDPDLRQQVLERAGGVPLFLVSCVQALGTGSLTLNGSSHVPWTLREAILQRMVALPEAAQQVLRLAAVVGRRVPRGLLLRVAARGGLAEEGVLEALEDCGRARLLIEVEADSYQLTHDLIREILLTDLGTARCALLHRRVAEALEQGPGVPPMEVLAYHFARSSEVDKAVYYLERAGDAARARYANAEAAEAYREVVSRLDALGRTKEAAPVREKWGDLLSRLGRYDEALVTLTEAEEAFRQAGNLEGELRALAQVGRTHLWRGRAEEGLAHLLPRLKRFSTLDASQGAAACFIALAYLYTGSGQFSEQLEAAEQAVTLARAMGDEQVLLVAQERRGGALLMLGRLKEARQVLTTEVIPVGEATGNLWMLIGALSNLGWVCLPMGEYHQGQAYQERALTLAERLGNHAQLIFLTYGHGLHAFYLGDWKQARGDFERAARLAASAGRSWSSAHPRHGLGLLALAEGQEEARGFLEETARLAARDHDLRVFCWAQVALAEDDLLAGRNVTASTRLATFIGTTNGENIFVKGYLWLLAWAELEMGEVVQALARLEGVIALALQEGMRFTLVEALRVQALAWIKEQRWEEAERALEETLALCQALPNPYVEAKTLYVYGLLQQAKGDPQQARERLRAALALLNKLGERLYASRIEQVLASLAPPHSDG